MRKLLTILLLAMSSTILAQEIPTDLLHKRWYRVHSVMLDGSRDLKTDFYFPAHNTWIFSPETFWRQFDYENRTPHNSHLYTLKDKQIIMSPNYYFDIAHISTDTLILVETLMQILDPDKRIVHFLVDARIIDSINSPDHVTGNVLNASYLMSPQLQSSFLKIEKNKNNDSYLGNSDFKITGNLTLRPKTNESSVEIIDIETKDKKYHEKIINWVSGSFINAYKENDYTGFEHYDEIIIPFEITKSVENEYSFGGQGVYLGESMNLTLAYYKPMKHSSTKTALPYKNKNSLSSSINFQEGMKLVEKKKYKKSIASFQKAFEDDYTNIDAIYNLIFVYSELKDKENMCKYISILKELEQKQGFDLYEMHCK